jgi:hydroxyacylglutathione hydrolase
MEEIMQVNERIHALRIPFKIPISPEQMVDRHVYSYIIFGDTITLIDTGVAGAESIIFDYIRENGRDPKDISMVILSHSHPDHIGSVKAIKDATNCIIAAHGDEQDWVEDSEKQFKERPVPGFRTLVGGPVKVDTLLAEGEIIDLGDGIMCEVIHTPGHSRGSISLLFKNEKTMISGDALPLPNDLPTYDDIVASVDSIKKLKSIKTIDILLSSWEAPIHGHEQIGKRINDGLYYLRRIHETVLKATGQGKDGLIDLCRFVVSELGLPPAAANPLAARAFASNLAAIEFNNLFEE